MTEVEARSAPLAPPPHRLFHAFGMAPLKSEGEAYWLDQGGFYWWTETIDGVRYRNGGPPPQEVEG